MQTKRIIELLKIEKECINRNNQPFGKNCDRECGKCDLRQNTDELIEMYDATLKIIEIFNQTLWERNVAIEQLRELGGELGEKPELIKKKIFKDFACWISEQLKVDEAIREYTENRWIEDCLYTNTQKIVTSKSSNWFDEMEKQELIAEEREWEESLND